MAEVWPALSPIEAVLRSRRRARHGFGSTDLWDTIALRSPQPESFLAAAAILCGAGGCVLDAQGNVLGEFEDLWQTTTVVATATEELAREITDALA